MLLSNTYHNAYCYRILNTFVYGMASRRFVMENKDCNLPLLYWIPKLHTCPYKQRNITVVQKCSIKPVAL